MARPVPQTPVEAAGTKRLAAAIRAAREFKQVSPSEFDRRLGRGASERYGRGIRPLSLPQIAAVSRELEVSTQIFVDAYLGQSDGIQWAPTRRIVPARAGAVALGQTIRTVRREAGATQAVLARCARSSRKSILGLEQARIEPSLQLVGRVTYALTSSVEEHRELLVACVELFSGERRPPARRTLRSLKADAANWT